jgi:hypothetical protein
MPNSLVSEICKLPTDFHGAGTVENAVLKFIAKLADEMGAVPQTAETGAGRTTVLFSQLSARHYCFALNNGNSLAMARNSPLFNPNTVTFVEGPTQKTLPRHEFTGKLAFALIDGPHAYPFADLEYYFFYPLIQTGGVLIIDDISIPTIRRMYDIVKREAMFRPIKIVGDTAFLRRTDEPVLDPYGDGWDLQGYNRLHYRKTLVLSWLAQRIPIPIKRLLRPE